MRVNRDTQSVLNQWPHRANCEGGFALFATLIIAIVVGIAAVSGLRTTELTEVLAGNSIQRGRAFHAAEGGLIGAEREISTSVHQRAFASSNATDGVFSRDSLQNMWWRDEDYTGHQSVDVSKYPGVVSPPVYVVEEIGYFESDGGTGIVSLDRGGSAYGRQTANGREVVLYRLQSKGVGSVNSAQAVVESLFVQSQ